MNDIHPLKPSLLLSFFTNVELVVLSGLLVVGVVGGLVLCIQRIKLHKISKQKRIEAGDEIILHKYGGISEIEDLFELEMYQEYLHQGTILFEKKLSDQLGNSIQGLTKKEILTLVGFQSLSKKTQQQIISILDLLEIDKYSKEENKKENANKLQKHLNSYLK